MNTVEINQSNFSDHVDKEGIVFIDFWASWCGPCKTFAPIFEGAAVKNPDIVWGKVDTDKETEIATGFGIRSIPTLMVFRDGILLYAQPGMVSSEKLDEIVTKVKELDMDVVRQEIAESECESGSCNSGSCGGGCCG
jgi:thioredoxin 1